MNSWLSNLKVATRMYLAFGAMVGLVAASLIAGWLQSRSHDADMQRLVDDNLRKLQLIERWVALSESTSVRILAVSSTSDPALGALFGPEIGPRVKEVGEMFKQVDALSTTPEERAEIEALVPTRKRLLATLGKVNELRAQGSAEAASALVKSDFAPVVQEYSAHLRKYAELQGKLMHQAVAQSREEGQRRALTLAALVALGLAVVSATVALTVRRLSATVDLAVETAQRVSRGDLTARPRVEGADELATLMRTLGDMAGSLEALVIDVRSGTASISVASSEIAQGNTDLSVRTEQQSANLQMAASAMEQMTSTVAQTADNARQAAAMAQEASAVATSGGQAVEQVVATMAQIQSASRRIAEIVGVIDGIAFQTNILALNAAVEAARAGEQGRGFAVVAAEVRTLAGRSAEAAREIKSLIADSSAKVDAGHAQVGEAGRRMAEIVSSVRRVSHLIAEISTASGEQNGGIVAVGRSVSEIEQATQQNAALVEQAAAAAGSMKSQAQRLEQAVSVFHVSAPA